MRTSLLRDQKKNKINTKKGKKIQKYKNCATENTKLKVDTLKSCTSDSHLVRRINGKKSSRRGAVVNESDQEP